MTLERPSERSGRIAALYEAHAPAGVRLAYLMTGDAALAEDLVQDAFARVVGRLGHLREESAFAAYLKRAIVNLAKNHFRRRAIERAFVDRQSPAGHSHQPDVAAIHTMRSALLRLPPRYRAALVLRYYEDLSDEQIAAVLECRPGTVRSLLSRATPMLREQLRGDDDA